MSCVTIQDTKEVQHLTESCYTGNGQTYHAHLKLQPDIDTTVKDLISVHRLDLTHAFSVLKSPLHSVTIQHVQANSFHTSGLFSHIYTFEDSDITMGGSFGLTIGPITISGGSFTTQDDIFSIDFNARNTELNLASRIFVSSFTALNTSLTPLSSTIPAIDFANEKTNAKIINCAVVLSNQYTQPLIQIKQGYLDIQHISITKPNSVYAVPIRWLGAGQLHVQFKETEGIEWTTLVEVNLPDNNQTLHIRTYTAAQNPFKLVEYASGSHYLKKARVRLALPAGLSCAGRSLIDHSTSTDLKFSCTNVRGSWDPEPELTQAPPKDYVTVPGWAIALFTIYSVVIVVVLGLVIFFNVATKLRERKAKKGL